MGPLAPATQTDRLVLRQWGIDDLDGLHAIGGDRRVAEAIAQPEPWSRTDSWRKLAEFIGHWTLRGYGLWALAERANPDFAIGWCGLWRPEGWPEPELGWTLNPEFWGRGYATEAARGALAWWIGDQGQPPPMSLIAHGNARSAAVARRLHCTQEDDFTAPFGVARVFRHTADALSG